MTILPSYWSAQLLQCAIRKFLRGLRGTFKMKTCILQSFHFYTLSFTNIWEIYSKHEMPSVLAVPQQCREIYHNVFYHNYNRYQVIFRVKENPGNPDFTIMNGWFLFPICSGPFYFCLLLVFSLRLFFYSPLMKSLHLCLSDDFHSSITFPSFSLSSTLFKLLSPLRFCYELLI